MLQKVWWYITPFRCSIAAWRTDGRTDRWMDGKNSYINIARQHKNHVSAIPGSRMRGSGPAPIASDVHYRSSAINPLDSKGNYSATSNNTKFVHWLLMGGLLYLVQRGGVWAGCGLAQSPPRCTKCNSLPINGQCIPITLLLYYDGPLLCGFNVAIYKGLIEIRIRCKATNRILLWGGHLSRVARGRNSKFRFPEVLSPDP